MSAPLSVVADPLWLHAFPGLTGIHDAAGLSALRSATISNYPAGTSLLCHGDPCKSFMLLVRGTVRVFESSEGGREIVLFRVRAGELCVLTLGDLLAARSYSANAVAEEDVELAIIPAAHFHDALAHSDAFRSYVLLSLTQRLGGLMSLIEQVTFQRLDLRLACLLGQKFGQQNTRCLHITHQELANELGTTREVVSRFLKEFENMGCIRLRRGEIELLSSDALSRLTCATAV